MRSPSKRRGIRPRYGAIGQSASIAIVERFIRSMKQECTRRLLVSASMAAMRHELELYATWYNVERPHMALDGNAPLEIWKGRVRRRRPFASKVVVVVRRRVCPDNRPDCTSTVVRAKSALNGIPTTCFHNEKSSNSAHLNSVA